VKRNISLIDTDAARYGPLANVVCGRYGQLQPI